MRLRRLVTAPVVGLLALHVTALPCLAGICTDEAPADVECPAHAADDNAATMAECCAARPAIVAEKQTFQAPVPSETPAFAVAATSVDPDGRGLSKAPADHPPAPDGGPRLHHRLSIFQI